MLQEHGDSWPGVFMGWMQQLLGENENGVANAFSLFVHNERVDVSMGCQRCESHELVMAAVAEMGPGQSLIRP